MKKQPAKKQSVKVKSALTTGEPLWNKPWLHIAIVLLITFITYLPTLKNDWTNWDDDQYVTNNSVVQGFTLTKIPEVFKEKQVVGNYHPLSMISLGIDHIWYDNEARGYHHTSLLIHLLNTLLLFLFILMLMNQLSNTSPPNKTGRAGVVWPASIAALLFAIHPMHVESVAWIAERKDVLYVCFFFAAAVTWMKYLKGTSLKWLWYGLTVLLFVCSLLSKAQAVTFPVLLVLIDLFLRRKFDVKVIVEKIPFFILSIAFGVLAIMAQKAYEAIQFIPFYSLTDRLLFASYALFSYIYKFFVPITLSAFHPYPLKNGQPYSMLIYASPVMLLVLAGIIVFFFRKSRVVWLGLGFFMANIILILQLLPVGNAIYAERYTYLAYTGLLIILGYVVRQLFFAGKNYSAYKMPVALALAALSIFFFVQTQARIKVWKNSEVLWLDVLSKYDYAATADNNLGSYYQRMKINDKAMYYFNNALRLQPDYLEALVNRSNIYREENKIDSCIIDCKHAIKVKPDYQGAYANLGIALRIAGKYDEALKAFNRAIELNPSDLTSYSSRAKVLALKGDFENSLKDYSTVLKFQPMNLDDISNRALAYYYMKKYAEALQDINIAMDFNRQQTAKEQAKNDLNTVNKLRNDLANYYLLRCNIEDALGNNAAALNDVNVAAQMGAQVNPAFVHTLQEKMK